MQLEFKTRINRENIDLFFDDEIKDNQYNYNMVEVDYVYIEYTIEFEVRDYGIKSTIISVNEFAFSASLDDYEDEFVIEGFEKEFSTDDLKISVCKDDMTVDFISLVSCEIDFRDKTITFS